MLLYIYKPHSFIEINKKMKKISITIAFIVVVLFIKAQTVTVIASNKGVAPIPAFSIEEPAVLLFFNTKLGEKSIWKHIEFSPDIALNSGNKLWFSDLWVKYNHWAKKDSLKNTVYTVGVDFPSLFGQQYILPSGEKINQLVTYFTVQGKVFRRINNNFSITFDYWYLQGTNMKYGVAGSYVSTSALWSKKINNFFTFFANPNVFYLDYTDGTKGFVSSLEFTVLHKKSGIFFKTLGLAPIVSKQVNSNWNISLGVTRKLF